MPPATARRIWPQLLMPWTLVTGPILTKELRVSSRHRRNFALRSGYLGLLTLFVALAWADSSDTARYGTAAMTINRMAETGKVVTMVVVLFQFVSVQLVSVVVCSNAISDEIHHKTLGTLMSTPVTSLQIVGGKLFSKLWQVLVLVGLSVPLLALVRVFGGVPMDYVLKAVAVTVSAAVFSASVSLLYSIFLRRAYQSILASIFTGLLLFLGIPLLGALALEVAELRASEREFVSFFAHVNPFITIAALTEQMESPSFSGIIWQSYWWGCCLSMWIGSAGVLTICVALVRRAGLRQIGGGNDTGAPASPPILVPARAMVAPAGPPTPATLTAPAGLATSQQAGQVAAAQARAQPAASPPPPPQWAPRPAPVRVRRVSNQPVLWKEMRPIPWRKNLFWLICLAVVAAGMMLAYAGITYEEEWDDEEFHIFMLMIWQVLGVLTTAVVAATPFTAEKESATWELLLTTGLSRQQILWGKFLGILRRTWIPWSAMLAHVVFFAWLGFLSPVGVVLIGMVIFNSFLPVAAAGLVFSAWLKRSTSAVVANLATVVAAWVVLPLLAMLALDAAGVDRREEVFFWDTVPTVQAISVTIGAQEMVEPDLYAYYDSEPFDWPTGRCDLEDTMKKMAIFSMVYLLLGASLLLLAHMRITQRRI